MNIHLLAIDISPQPTMIRNSSPIASFILQESLGSLTESESSPIATFTPDDGLDSSRESSPIPASIPDKDSIPDEDDSSGSQWWYPQNQLGLESQYQQDDKVALDKKGNFLALWGNCKILKLT